MKKYEYKYVKREDPEISITLQTSFLKDEEMLTGFGLDGWKVHSYMSPFWLLEREVSQGGEVDLTIGA